MDSLVLDNFDIDVTQRNVSQYLAPTRASLCWKCLLIVLALDTIVKEHLNMGSPTEIGMLVLKINQAYEFQVD